jgi:hypothetical protein
MNLSYKPSTNKRNNSLETMDGSNWEIDAEFGNLPVHEEAYYQALYDAAVAAEIVPSVNDPNVIASFSSHSQI